jgi:hypothetical protein
MAFLDNLAQQERKFYLVSYLVGRTARALDAALRVFSIFQHKRERERAQERNLPHTRCCVRLSKNTWEKILKSSSYSGFDARTDGIFATPLRSKTSCRRCRRRRRARFKEHFALPRNLKERRDLRTATTKIHYADHSRLIYMREILRGKNYRLETHLRR